MDTVTENLGSASFEQKTINSEVEINDIIQLLLNEKAKINDLLNLNLNDYVKDLWKSFFINKEFKFPINKHSEFYLRKNLDNIDLIFRYINFRYIFYLSGKKRIDFGYPPYLLIEPVSTCNLKCPFCFQTDKTFTKKPFMGIMDFDFFKKVVDEADQIGIGAVTIASRGEPTLHKNLKEMLSYVGSKKNIFEIKLNTNATFLNENLCHEIFKNNISQVVISADHYEKKTFEELRKNSNFDKVVKNVDNLFKIRKQYPENKTEIRVSGINYYKNTNTRKFYEFWIKRSDHVSIGEALERWDTYNNSTHPDINDPCENLWDRMYVWFDGKVNPCDADYKSYLSYGNVKESSIREIWNSTIIQKTRKDHIDSKRCQITPCNKCGVTFIK